MRDKTTNFRMVKTADFENGTQPAILKMRQKRRFVIIQVASLGLPPKEISMKLKYHYTKQPILIFAAQFFNFSGTRKIWDGYYQFRYIEKTVSQKSLVLAFSKIQLPQKLKLIAFRQQYLSFYQYKLIQTILKLIVFHSTENFKKIFGGITILSYCVENFVARIKILSYSVKNFLK